MIEDQLENSDPGGVTLRYDVKLIDSSSISAEDVSDILSLPNSKRARIDSIAIATNYSVEPKVHLAFAASNFGSTISYSVTGTQATSSFISSQIDEVVSRARPWYSRIATSDSIGILVNLITGVSILGVAASVVLRMTEAPKEVAQADAQVTFGSLNSALALLIVIVFSLLGVGALLNRIRSWLFPIAIFAIGDGAEIITRLVWWRSLIGVGVLLAVTINVATALLL